VIAGAIARPRRSNRGRSVHGLDVDERQVRVALWGSRTILFDPDVTVQPAGDVNVEPLDVFSGVPAASCKPRI